MEPKLDFDKVLESFQRKLAEARREERVAHRTKVRAALGALRGRPLSLHEWDTIDPAGVLRDNEELLKERAEEVILEALMDVYYKP